MNAKTLIGIGIAIGGIGGGWLGAILGDGSFFSVLSIVCSIGGAFLGIYLGYKISQYM
jgi:hypothetical protein